jgi:hypothetical protein
MMFFTSRLSAIAVLTHEFTHSRVQKLETLIEDILNTVTLEYLLLILC